MRQQAYNLIYSLNQKYHGYIKTADLLKEGFSNRQIGQLHQEGYLEKLSNGYYWLIKYDLPKPGDYKAIEVSFVNERAVVIAESACYYQGLISVEPPVLSIATRRTDRHQMRLPFPLRRHYFSEAKFEDDKKTVQTEFGNYDIYSIERSVCDCIRFREDIDSQIFDLVIENYHKRNTDEATRKRMLAYAKYMKFEAKARDII